MEDRISTGSAREWLAGIAGLCLCVYACVYVKSSIYLPSCVQPKRATAATSFLPPESCPQTAFPCKIMQTGVCPGIV